MLLDFSRIFGRQKNSKDVAKERLKLVLIHDRANVSPGFLEMLKSEIIKVISNYMDIDENALNIQLTRQKAMTAKRCTALYANIPIKNIRDSGR